MAPSQAGLHADIAHPINSACREVMQNAILKSYQEEKERAKQPGYTCRYDEYDAGDYDESYTSLIGDLNRGGEQFRSHGPHQSRGNHDSKAPVAARETHNGDNGFGAGIL